MVLHIVVINEVRFGGSKHISNFESGLQKDETCFSFFKNEYLPPVWRCLVCWDSTAETFNAVRKMQVTFIRAEDSD